MNRKEDSREPRDGLRGRIERWRELMEILPFPVSVHDGLCALVFANRASEVLFGENMGEEAMTCCKRFGGGKDHDKDCLCVKALSSGGDAVEETGGLLAGKVFLVTASPVFEGGSPVGVVKSALDVTKIKMEAEELFEVLEVYAQTLNGLKEREKTAGETKEAFLNMLEDISDSYRELEDLFMKFVSAMVSALDAKSTWTRGHSERVAAYAEQIARELGLDEGEIRDIRLAGLLHDVGKIGTCDYLLEKPERLTEEEYGVVKKHPSQGARILGGIKQLRHIVPTIKYHHERLDGKGYPEGLENGDIPLQARILHVADSFDSMTADRPYRPSPGIEYAMSELEENSGSQFDPHVVRVFLRLIREKSIKVPEKSG